MVSLWVSLAQAQKNLALDWKHFQAAVWLQGKPRLGVPEPPGKGKLRPPVPPQLMERHRVVRPGLPR